MVNYLQLGQHMMKYFPMTEGCTSTIKLSKNEIEALAKKNPEVGKVITEFIEGATNPTLEIAQKAQRNYAIAGFKIKNGETVLGTGAYSTSTGTNGIVEKMHVEKGDIITTITQEGGEIKHSEISKSELRNPRQAVNDIVGKNVMEEAKANNYGISAAQMQDLASLARNVLKNGDRRSVDRLTEKLHNGELSFEEGLDELGKISRGEGRPKIAQLQRRDGGIDYVYEMPDGSYMSPADFHFPNL